MKYGRIIIIVFSVLILFAAFLGWKIMERYKAPALTLPADKVVFYIPTGSDYGQVKQSLISKGFFSGYGFFSAFG